MDNKKTNHSLYVYIGSKLRKRRKHVGLTEIDFGEKVNMNQQMISRYERGVNKFSIDILINLLSSLEMSKEDIINFMTDIVLYHQGYSDTKLDDYNYIILEHN